MYGGLGDEKVNIVSKKKLYSFFYVSVNCVIASCKCLLWYCSTMN